MLAPVAELLVEDDGELDKLIAQAGQLDPRRRLELVAGAAQIAQPEVEHSPPGARQAGGFSRPGEAADARGDFVALGEPVAPLFGALSRCAGGIAHRPIRMNQTDQRPAPVGRPDRGGGIAERHERIVERARTSGPDGLGDEPLRLGEALVRCLTDGFRRHRRVVVPGECLVHRGRVDLAPITTDRALDHLEDRGDVGAARPFADATALARNLRRPCPGRQGPPR